MAKPEVQPTPEDQAKAQAVASAGAEAAAAEPERAEDAAREAMRGERDRQQLPMSDEDIDKVAGVFANKAVPELIDQLKTLGAFDPPPEAPRAPAAATAPPPPGEPAPGETAPETATPSAPERKTWAHRFMGQ